MWVDNVRGGNDAGAFGGLRPVLEEPMGQKMVEATPEALDQLKKDLDAEGGDGKAARLFFEGFG